jgi:hypothetical protein
VIVRRGSGPDRLKAVSRRIVALPARALARAGVRRAVLYERHLEPGAAARRPLRLEHGWLDRQGIGELASATGSPGNRSGHAAVLRSGYRRPGTITTIRTSPRRRAVRFRASS